MPSHTHTQKNIIYTACPWIFAWHSKGLKYPSATKFWVFWSRTREKSGEGERVDERQREWEEKWIWRSNLSCFQTVIYENIILLFLCNNSNLLNVNYCRVIKSLVVCCTINNRFSRRGGWWGQAWRVEDWRGGVGSFVERYLSLTGPPYWDSKKTVDPHPNY